MTRNNLSPFNRTNNIEAFTFLAKFFLLVFAFNFIPSDSRSTSHTNNYSINHGNRNQKKSYDAMFLFKQCYQQKCLSAFSSSLQNSWFNTRPTLQVTFSSSSLSVSHEKTQQSSDVIRNDQKLYYAGTKLDRNISYQRGTNYNDDQKYQNHSSNKDPIIFISEIQHCKNAFELGKIIRNSSHPCISNDSCAFQYFDALNEKILNLESCISPRDISGLLNGLSKQRISYPLRKRQRYIMNILANIALQQIHAQRKQKRQRFTSRDISMIINALAKVKLYHGPLFDAAATEAIQIIDTFNAQALSNTVNGFAKMNHRHSELFDAIAAASIPIIHTCNEQNLANILNAFAKMNHQHYVLFDTIADTAIPLIQQNKFNAQDLSNTVNAFAKMNHVHSTLYDAVAAAAISIIDQFRAQALANTVNAFAKMNHQHTVLFDTVATVAIPIMGTFNAQNLANTINAYAKMSHAHSELFHAIATASYPILHEFNAQALANLVNGFAKMNNDRNVNKATMSSLYPKLFDTVAVTALPIIDQFNAQDLSNTVNAYSKINHDHPVLFDSVAKAAIPIIDEFNAQALSNTVNAFSKLNYRHDDENYYDLFAVVAKASIKKMDEFNAQNLANTVNAFAKMDHHDSDLFDAVAKAAIPILDEFNSQALANTASAFAKLRMTGIQTELLFSNITETLISTDTVDEYHFLDRFDKFSIRQLSDISYAFLKIGYLDMKLLDAIGKAVVAKVEKNGDDSKASNNVEPLDARALGFLAACFSHLDVSSSKQMLSIVYDKFQRLDSHNVHLQSVADIAGGMQKAQELNVASPSMIQFVIELAISKSSESRVEDVKDILLGLGCVDHPNEELRQNLLHTYMPLFYCHRDQLSKPNFKKILRIYDQSGILAEQSRKDIDIYQ